MAEGALATIAIYLASPNEKKSIKQSLFIAVTFNKYRASKRMGVGHGDTMLSGHLPNITQKYLP